MRSRDESTALKALVALGETHTEFFRVIINRLDSIDGQISTLIDTLADHVAHHGEAS